MNPLPSDGAIQQKITGPWWHSQPSFSSPFGAMSRLTIASNGDYVCHITFYNGRIHTNSLEGRWQVKDGLLIDTITKVNPPRQPVPSVSTNRIVRVNDRELVYRTQSDYVVLFRRIKQVNR
jgi:hypothetical protein